MGVKGLTTFVGNNQRVLFEDFQLHSTKLVIDGQCLPNVFYSRSLDPGNHGGEFQKFYAVSSKFFCNLKSCGIEPFVVLDGGYDVDGKKISTIQQRCQQKLNSLKVINRGKYATLYPPMAAGVFRRVMKDFKVNFVFTEFEADKEVAVLANQFQCPVLGNDSDFCIMDIHQGYIPVDGLSWKKLRKMPKSKSWHDKFFLHCRRYKISTFCNCFQIQPCLMPLFASLHGNDYVKVWSSNLDAVIATVEGIRHRSVSTSKMHSPWQSDRGGAIGKLLYLLSYFSTHEECFSEIMEQTNEKRREKVRQNLLTSCRMYDITRPTPVVDFFLGRDQQLLKHPLVTEFSLPVHFVKLWQVGLVPKMALNVLLSRRHFLRPQIEKLSEVSSTTCCKFLIRILSGIMLVDVWDTFKQSDAALTVDIPCREGHTLKSNHVEPLYEILGYGKVPSFKEMPSLSKVQRLSLLMSSLNVRDVGLGNAPQSFCLVLLVTIYWFRNAKPSVSQHHLCSLMLGWVQGVAWCKHNTQLIPHGSYVGFDFDFYWDKREVSCILQNFERLKRHDRLCKNALDLDVSHAFAQWLDCVRFTYYLNQLLLGVFPVADMTVLFNGMLMHNICFQLKTIEPSRHKNWIERNLLANAPNARKLFTALKTFFSRHLELHW